MLKVVGGMFICIALGGWRGGPLADAAVPKGYVCGLCPGNLEMLMPATNRTGATYIYMKF